MCRMCLDDVQNKVTANFTLFLARDLGSLPRIEHFHWPIDLVSRLRALEGAGEQKIPKN